MLKFILFILFYLIGSNFGLTWITHIWPEPLAVHDLLKNRNKKVKVLSLFIRQVFVATYLPDLLAISYLLPSSSIRTHYVMNVDCWSFPFTMSTVIFTFITIWYKTYSWTIGENWQLVTITIGNILRTISFPHRALCFKLLSLRPHWYKHAP